MFDAIVLAGGSARRMGGADKPGLRVGGRPLLDHVLDAVAGAGRVVVVGARRPVDREIFWCREEPPGSGPVAATAAGLGRTTADTVLVLAADLPWIAGAVPVLLGAAAQTGIALLADASGHPNYLAGAWRRASLCRALDAVGDPAGVPMRALTAASGVDPVLVADEAGWGRDCDTWDDLADARERARLCTDRREGTR